MRDDGVDRHCGLSNIGFEHRHDAELGVCPQLVVGPACFIRGHRVHYRLAHRRETVVESVLLQAVTGIQDRQGISRVEAELVLQRRADTGMAVEKVPVGFCDHLRIGGVPNPHLCPPNEE
ncbi:hypothetical protein [Streptomyces sp. NPDC055005]